MKWLVSLCHFCEQHGPNVLSCSEYSFISDEAALLNSRELSEAKAADDSRQSRCAACCPFDAEEPAYVSVLTTRSGETIAVSTSSEVANADEYATMRHACVRALIREVTPGLEGAVLFTIEEESAEDKVGRTTYVLSYSFTLQDKFARGFRRSYTILVCCAPTTAASTNQSASRQQSTDADGDQVNEQEECRESHSGTYAMSDAATNEYVLTLVPQLIRRLYVFVQQIKTKCDAVFDRDQQAGSGRALRLQNPTWQVNLVRSVCTLLDDAYVMRTFHAFFAELLLFVAGSNTASDSTDVVHKVSERVGPFVNIRDVYDAFRRNVSAASSERERDADTITRPATRARGAALATTDEFAELLYHTLVGNQLICVCETDVSVAETFLRALVASLLPRECAQLRVSDSSYVEAFACNLLALRNINALPAEVSDDANLYCVVVLTVYDAKATTEVDANRMYTASVLRRNGATADLERDRRRRVAAIVEVGRIVTLVGSDVEIDLIEELLCDLRTELLNKARMFYACFKLGMFTEACAKPGEEHVANQRNRLIEILNTNGSANSAGANSRSDVRSAFDAQQVLFMFFARAIAHEFSARQKALAAANRANAHVHAQGTPTHRTLPT